MYNKAVIVGNATKDTELRYLTSGTAVASFTIATSHKWKTDGGEAKEETFFANCSAFGKLAEICSQYIKKGQQVLVEGRLKEERWETDKGDKRNKTVILVNEMKLLGRRGDGGGESGGQRDGHASDNQAQNVRDSW